MSKDCGLVVEVCVSLRARRCGMVGRIMKGDGTVALRMAVTEPPEDGRANQALCTLLAEALGVLSSARRIIRGANARDKLVHVAGDAGALSARLTALTP